MLLFGKEVTLHQTIPGFYGPGKKTIQNTVGKGGNAVEENAVNIIFCFSSHCAQTEN